MTKSTVVKHELVHFRYRRLVVLVRLLGSNIISTVNIIHLNVILYLYSRSQCIINIRCDLHNLDEDHPCTAVLTIVDLAGAEREKRTGNQVQIVVVYSFVLSHFI